MIQEEEKEPKRPYNMIFMNMIPNPNRLQNIGNIAN